MMYQFIDMYREEFTVRDICRVLDVARGAYYAWSKREGSSCRQRDDERLGLEITRIFQGSRGRYGSPRVFQELRANGERCSEKRVARLMKTLGLEARRRPKRVSTTDSSHAAPCAENLLARRFDVADIAGPNLFWCSDITYVDTDEGWLYLAIVLDLFSRRIVGWSMSSSLAQDFVLDAFKMAVAGRHPEPGLLHHSDRGSQYAGYEHRQLLIGSQAVISMSRKGNCWDNAVVESFFASLKKELVHKTRFETREQARSALFEFIEVYYNRERRHSALGYKSPVEFERYYSCLRQH